MMQAISKKIILFNPSKIDPALIGQKITSIKVFFQNKKFFELAKQFQDKPFVLLDKIGMKMGSLERKTYLQLKKIGKFIIEEAIVCCRADQIAKELKKNIYLHEKGVAELEKLLEDERIQRKKTKLKTLLRLKKDRFSRQEQLCSIKTLLNDNEFDRFSLKFFHYFAFKYTPTRSFLDLCASSFAYEILRKSEIFFRQSVEEKKSFTKILFSASFFSALDYDISQLKSKKHSLKILEKINRQEKKSIGQVKEYLSSW